MTKKKAWIVVVAMVVLIGLLGFVTTIGFGPTGTGAAKNIITGLDLAGGVSITYQATGEGTPTEDQMKDTIYKLQQRVYQYSTEAQVYQEGVDRINIEIPGVTDANKILEELGKPGSLKFTLADGTEVLTGTDVESASSKAGADSMGNTEYGVELLLTSEGAEKFAKATTENVGKQIMIIYDNQTISAPSVNEAITGGKAYISGMSGQAEAENLASFIRIGSLSLQLEELRSNVVGAQLGEDAISSSLLAGAIGLAIVILFMIFVYRIPGVVSALALLIYTGLMLFSLNAFDLTLTLPGIAGIILSIGMAVDANVIIYARIRDEVTEGKNVKGSIKSGFQKAFSAILDGNITTLIAAAVLGFMGTGSVKGFAQTLALGIVLSMFTALIISRLIINAFYTLGCQDPKYYGTQKVRKELDFVGKRKMFFVISIVCILVGPVAMGVYSAQTGKALNYSLDFMGGTATNVTFNEDMSIADIDASVKPVVQKVTNDANIQTQKVSGTNQVIIKTRELSLDERNLLDETLVKEFAVDGSLITAESISSTVSNEMRMDAFIAVVVATIFMLLYIWFRFKDLRFASSAVMALIHDVLLVVVCYAVLRVPVGTTFIACMLTIVGYSINATIVIFDRIRENVAEMKNKDNLKDMVNKSITQTMTRSIYTSFTTFIMVAVLYVMGVASIKEFALPLMVGIICGAYSSVCITGTLWYVFKTKIKAKSK